jgi:UDP-N-acetyl-D-glucosamine dehydrogenase
MKVDLVVVGVGYVGLPLARQACSAGLSVVGYDISGTVVSALAAGHSHVDDVSDDDLARMTAAGFRPTTDPSWISRADTVVLCVPTGLTADGLPDLTAVRSAAEIVAGQLRPGTLVVLESTSFPGTTDEIVLPILQSSHLTAGQDFHLGYSPERIDPGNRDYGVRNTPKIVSGYTPLCTKHCVAFYGRFVDSLVVADGLREAETAKLLENTYRYVNIALVNELAMFCHRLDIDVWDVLRCAGTKPFGFQAFHPGSGIGGHCIPVDPLYLTAKARAEGFTFSVVEAARAANAAMPTYVVTRAGELLAPATRAGRRPTVLLLGVTYKPDISDVRESPAVPVARGLLDRGVDVAFHDPHVDRFPELGSRVRRTVDLAGGLASADLTILLQRHRNYDVAHLGRVATTLLDVTGQASGENIVRL